jgi:hypothetical protein
VHSIFGFSNLNRVVVRKINMHGMPSPYEPVTIFADAEDAYERHMIQTGWTDMNGTAVFYLPDGVYNVISGWGSLQDASVYTVRGNITIKNDTIITLDEREAMVVDFDFNKTAQILSEKYDSVYYNGEYVRIGFSAWYGYPGDARTYITPTDLFKAIFTYTYYPAEYYNHSNRWMVESPVFHKLLYNLTGISGNVSFSPNYAELAERHTDYKVAIEPEPAILWMYALHPDMWYSIAAGYTLNAPLHRVEWLTPCPVKYLTGYEEYQRWAPSNWSYHSGGCYPPGRTALAVGEHPFTSGAEIELYPYGLDIYGYLSKDAFLNSFANHSSPISGNLTVVKDGALVRHLNVSDYFYTYISAPGAHRFDVILNANSSPMLSTQTRTELNFDTGRDDWRPPRLVMKAPGSDLNNTISSDRVRLVVDIADESNISGASLEYSLDNGTTWSPAALRYRGVAGCLAISGGNRTVINESYIPLRYSKVRVFLDDTENNDEIHYSYSFTLQKSDGTEYTRSGNSTDTLANINETLYYDEDADGALDLFKDIRINTYTSDNDTLNAKVEAWSGTEWECLYGSKIRRYEADLGELHSGYVSLRAHASDTQGNSITHRVTRGLHVANITRARVYIEPSYQEALIGTNFTVNVSVDPRGFEVYGAEYTLYFDATKLEAISQSQGWFLTQDGNNSLVIVNNINNTLGVVEYGETRLGTTGGVSGPGVLATLLFHVKPNATEGNATLNLSDVILTGVYNNSVHVIPSTEEGGVVNITTNRPPVADCGADKLSCENVGAPVQFDASASFDVDGNIVDYQWDFGDGHIGTGVAPKHIYTSYNWNGAAYQPFTVTLTVTDDRGATDTDTQLVTIWIAGDANGDGRVNILDAAIVGLNWKTAEPCADLNNDGKVNIIDAATIGLNWGRVA